MTHQKPKNKIHPPPANGHATRPRNTGSAGVALLTFAAGIGMIAFAFALAFQLFQVPPEVRLQIEPGKPIEVGQAASTLAEVLLKVLLLVAMAAFGSMVANRGVKLYSAQNPTPKPHSDHKSSPKPKGQDKETHPDKPESE